MKNKAPSGGPIATTIWMIQIWSACDRFTPGFSPPDHACVNSADGCRTNFVHHRGTNAKANAASATDAAFFKRVQISQHHQRQRYELQDIRIVLKTLEIEDRIEREHHDHEERAAAIDDTQRNQPRDHEPAAERRHRERISGPVRDRKDREPETCDPAGEWRMLAVAELEFLAPGEGFRDIHMDVLRRLEINQNKSPQHRMGGGKAEYQPKAGLWIAGARGKPRRQSPDGWPAART